MRQYFLVSVLVSATALFGAERIDNVLVKLIPRDSVSLFGVQMDQVKNTAFYKKLIAQQKLTQLDEFAAQTGFDPRRDVRELLVASNLTKNSGVLLARGNFRVTPEALAKMKDMRRTTYKGYTLWVSGTPEAGFSILDSTLVIAGPVATMHAALDQYRDHNADPGKREVSPLLERAMAVPMRNQIWLVSQGGSDFLGNNMPNTGPAANFGVIFKNLESLQLQADLSEGLNANIAGSCKTEADAKSLSDAARGLIGFGRLSVPEGQPQLLRVWDAIQVTQQGRTLSVTADIPAELVDRLISLMDGGPKTANDRSSSYSSEGESHRPRSKNHPH
jgi:hypothetical protein